ncbi:MAG: type II and III secretion system protein, partial [candidate division WS1 bacterium]|nr:type II and III secretion system protein [candidate division WS1 bacterium]
LVIRPRVIAETGEIMCEIEPSIADVSGTGVGGLPVITMRRAKSTMRLRDGHAVVIGGLIQEQESERVSRVPILSEIPIIGGLFRSTSKSASRREIVILIAPHLLDEDGNVSGQLLSDVLLGAEYQFPQVDAETEQAEPTPSERRERRRRTE